MPNLARISDPNGIVLPSDEAGVGTARTIIGNLLEDSGPGQPRPIIMVRNEAGEIIYNSPAIENRRRAATPLSVALTMARHPGYLDL